MIADSEKRRYALPFRLMVFLIILTFSIRLILFPINVEAQAILDLPTVGTIISPSISYTPAIIAGMRIYPENPLLFDFIIDTGDDNLQGEAFRKESQKLINYFFATLTVPDHQMWVNLSPYQKDRIMANKLSGTEMGRDMLVQDYILKQFVASLMYPEEKLGDKFWRRVYAKSKAMFGSIKIPTNTFNKVWIVPKEAVVYVNDTNVFVSESYLSVMLEEDYLALESNLDSGKHGLGDMTKKDIEAVSAEAKEIIREVIIPEIEKEVNEGKNFANLRQIYHSMILGTWYKKNLKESVLGKAYINKNKMKGIDLVDKKIKEKIYNQYLTAFKKGVYDIIKEEYDPLAQGVISRKYFSGGLKNVQEIREEDTALLASAIAGDRRKRRAEKKGIYLQKVTEGITPIRGDGEAIEVGTDNAMAANLIGSRKSELFYIALSRRTGKLLRNEASPDSFADIPQEDIDALIADESRLSLFIISWGDEGVSIKALKTLAASSVPLSQIANIMLERLGRDADKLEKIQGMSNILKIPERGRETFATVMSSLKFWESSEQIITEIGQRIYIISVIEIFYNETVNQLNLPEDLATALKNELIEKTSIPIVGGMPISTVMGYVTFVGSVEIALGVVDSVTKIQKTGIHTVYDYIVVNPWTRAAFGLTHDPRDEALQRSFMQTSEALMQIIDKKTEGLKTATGRPYGVNYSLIYNPETEEEDLQVKTIITASREGETLREIAREFGVENKNILKFNPGSLSNPKYQIDQILPAGKAITVNIDSAMVAAPGGIDFNSGIMHFKETGQSANFNVDNAMLSNIQIDLVEGILLNMISVTPIVDFAPLLGKATGSR